MTQYDTSKIYIQYVEDVLSGKIQACEYIKKAWNLTFAYSQIRGSCKTLSYKNKQRTPTPNMNATKQSNPIKDALWAG